MDLEKLLGDELAFLVSAFWLFITFICLPGAFVGSMVFVFNFLTFLGIGSGFSPVVHYEFWSVFVVFGGHYLFMSFFPSYREV